MADKTGIEWTDATWNPVRGCSRVSEACRFCYAEDQAARIIKSDRARGVPEGDGAYDGLLAKGGQWNGTIRTVAELLTQPLRWAKPRRIFVNSMSDLFHESLADDVIDRIFAVMALAPRHTFQVLTKRPERMQAYLSTPNREGIIKGAAWELLGRMPKQSSEGMSAQWPLPNVWIGVSVEDQPSANERVPMLLSTPAAVRWLSMEPLLGAVDLERIQQSSGDTFSATYGWMEPGSLVRVRGVDWVVVGGESGPDARPMHPDWVDGLQAQCARAGVPFLFKQWGEWIPVCEMSEEQLRKIYKSNVKADNPEDQSTLDELHGRACSVARGVLQLDGAVLEVTDQQAFKPGAMTVFKVGKRFAGRALGGQYSDGYPVADALEVVNG